MLKLQNHFAPKILKIRFQKVKMISIIFANNEAVLSDGSDGSAGVIDEADFFVTFCQFELV